MRSGEEDMAISARRARSTRGVYFDPVYTVYSLYRLQIVRGYDFHAVNNNQHQVVAIGLFCP